MTTEYGGRDTALSNTILRTVVGSGVHGLAIAGTDDHDEMGVYIPPPYHVLGVRQYRPDYVWRTQPEGARSGPGDTDLVMYSLRKYLSLAVKGNPTALLPLFAPLSDVLAQNHHGAQLRKNRAWFLSRDAVERFLGYMHSQHERMLGGGKRNRVPKRPELVEAHGYDTKFASHALRLAMQGYQLARHGALILPMPGPERDEVLTVKRGERELWYVSSRVGAFERATRALIDQDKLAVPAHPAVEKIEAWSVAAHREHWGWS